MTEALDGVLEGAVLSPCRDDDLAELLVLQRCCWVREAVVNATLDLPPLTETPQDVRDAAREWSTWVVRRAGRLVGSVRGRAVPHAVHLSKARPATAPLVVRPAAAADAEAVASVHLASRAAAMPWLPRLHTDEETVGWVREVVLPGCRTWVAQEGATGAVVGFAALDGDVLDQLYLLPRAWRRGIGTRLLEVVRAASPSGLTLRVFARNAPARTFYESRGFAVVAAGDGGGNEEGLPDVTYRWSPPG